MKATLGILEVTALTPTLVAVDVMEKGRQGIQQFEFLQ